jgi:hypothetical protein
MPEAAPLVSVVIAVYNGARVLDAALHSVAAQTHTRLEVILVDDGSTDESREIAETWTRRDQRMRLVRAAHLGPQHARNAGVGEARGAFVAHLDQDNLAAPLRIAAQLAWMERAGVDVCGSCTRAFGDRRHLGWMPERHDDVLRESVFRCALPHSTILLPAAIARDHPFDPARACGGDALAIGLAARYRVGNVPQPLVGCRSHDGQQSVTRAEAVRDDRRAIGREAFRRLFADATAADEAAVMRIVCGQPFAERDERARAAAWMTRLAATEDAMVRRLMAERWAVASGS